MESSGYLYCQIGSPAIGYVKNTAVYIDSINETQNSAQSVVQLSYKPTIKNPEFLQTFRIVPHLLHNYLPITNALSDYYIAHFFFDAWLQKDRIFIIAKPYLVGFFVTALQTFFHVFMLTLARPLFF